MAGTQRVPREYLLVLSRASCLPESRTAQRWHAAPERRLLPSFGGGGPAAGHSGLQSGALFLPKTPTCLGKVTLSMATEVVSYSLGLVSPAQPPLHPHPKHPHCPVLELGEG